MDKIYKIEISISESLTDNQKQPYYWMLLSNNGQNWCNECFGWASSPQNAWKDAYQFFCSFKKDM